VLEKLICYGTVSAASEIYPYTSESCRVELYANPAFAPTFCDLFARHHLFLDYYDMDTVSDGETVHVICNQMEVSRVNLDPEEKGYGQDSYTVLQWLEAAHYICRLEKEPDDSACVSFSYAAPRIKRLLTAPAEILKIYVYYQLQAIGYFDEVAAGVHFCSADDDAEEELDLVLVKGFRSVIVECMGEREMSPDRCLRLCGIAEQFGIGTVIVLIGNVTQSGYVPVHTLNCIKEGADVPLNILAISDPEQIENIGRTLKEITEAMPAGAGQHQAE
ncbi:MAG: hypothetical protein LUG54_03710, partial [Clostridiales bacterium]|nr:hypothetical protein [Clostridiales bacterium]